VRASTLSLNFARTLLQQRIASVRLWMLGEEASPKNTILLVSFQKMPPVTQESCRSPWLSSIMSRSSPASCHNLTPSILVNGDHLCVYQIGKMRSYMSEIIQKEADSIKSNDSLARGKMHKKRRHLKQIHAESNQSVHLQIFLTWFQDSIMRPTTAFLQTSTPARPPLASSTRPPT